MPHYFFDHWDGDEHIVDDEGSDYADLEAARLGAIEGARCIMSAEVRAGELRFDQHLELRDAEGRIADKVYFSDAVEVTAAGTHVPTAAEAPAG